MSPEPKTIVFVGKGGVGKTTVSSNLSLSLSEEKKPTYLLSIDPASNLFDFFDITKDTSIKSINKYLTIEECDLESKMNKEINKTLNNMKAQYKYLTVLNLEHLFKAIKYSPGLNEYISLLAIYEVYIKIKNNNDYFLIDTPPTGLLLNILSLLKTSTLWLKQLIDLRKKIIDKRLFLDHLKNKESLNKKDIPIKILKKEVNIVDSLNKLFTNNLTKFCLIINNDNLSIKEGEHIISKCKDLDISIDLIIVNKTKNKHIGLPKTFINYKVCTLPHIESGNNIIFNTANIKNIIDLLYY